MQNKFKMLRQPYLYKMTNFKTSFDLVQRVTYFGKGMICFEDLIPRILLCTDHREPKHSEKV